jgi:excisionase family DNA binding protein
MDRYLSMTDTYNRRRSDVHVNATSEQLLTVDDVVSRFRVSRWSVYKLISSRQLRTLKIGRRRLISPSAVSECIELLEEMAA